MPSFGNVIEVAVLEGDQREAKLHAGARNEVGTHTVLDQGLRRRKVIGIGRAFDGIDHFLHLV